MKTFISCCTCCKTYTNNPHRHSLTLLSKMFIFFLFSFFFSSNVILPFPTPPPTTNDALPRLSLSYCDISQWAGRRKRCKEAAGAPSRFHPLLYLSFICVCVYSGVCVLVCVCLLVHACARTLVHSHNSLLRLLEDAVWEREVLSRGCPSIPHLPLRRALCFCTAHVTAIVPN